MREHGGRAGDRLDKIKKTRGLMLLKMVAEKEKLKSKVCLKKSHIEPPTLILNCLV